MIFISLNFFFPNFLFFNFWHFCKSWKTKI